MENKKKAFIALFGILALAGLTFGATYAYFTFSSQNDFTDKVNIEASTEALGSGVSITKTTSDLTLNVTAVDMLVDNAGSYYASGSEEDATIGKVVVAGLGTFNCTYTIDITKTSTDDTKDLYTKFQSEEYTNKSENQIYFSLNGNKYDFNTANLFDENGKITYNGTLSNITSETETNITANMVIVNDSNIDQTYLNDSNIKLSFEVTEFNCELVEEDNNSQVAIASYLMENPTTGLTTSTQEGGLYRYQGTTANNYICFGTSDKATCTGNTDAYMYRIMGINSSNQLKLIKKEALNSAIAWHSISNGYDTTWPNSTLYSSINGSTFLTNTTYVPSGWSDKIATTTWKYGDNTTNNTTAANLYSIESAWTSTTSAKIGLMYMHDYYYGMSGGNNCSSSGAYSTCKTSWLYLSNSDSGAPSAYEWTMSRYGQISSGGYSAWNVYSSGYVNGYDLTSARSVRPVFYLTSDVSIVGGSGTLSDPFIIG